MQHPFTALAPDYVSSLAIMKIDPARERELMARAELILASARRHADEWAEVKAVTGVPLLWGIASFERECDCNYACSPAQGDRWDRKSINVPRDLGPYRSWGESAVAAYRIDHLDQVGADNWTWTRALYEGELFNGFGPRNHGRHSGYLWSWSSVYTGGKYVADGEWDPSAHDKQCGMVPMMVALLRLDSSLALADGLPVPAVEAPSIVPAPAPVPIGMGGRVGLAGVDTAWLQKQLNRLGEQPPLIVDGSYGRATRRAVAAFQAKHQLTPDGLFGPATLAVLQGLA